MDLRLVFRAISKHKFLLFLSIVVGLGLALNALYELKFVAGRGFSSSSRSSTTYETKKLVLIDEPGFPIGRSIEQAASPYQYERTVRLAITYSKLMTSSKVLAAVRQRLRGDLDIGITATAVKDSPVIKVKVIGQGSYHVRRAADLTVEAFGDYLKAAQKAGRVPPDERIFIRSLGPAKRPVATPSRRFEIAFIYFLVPVAGMVFTSLLLDNLGRELPD